MRRRQFITLLAGTVSVCLGVSAAAQEGHYGWATANGTGTSTRNSRETMVSQSVGL
jgi:hypothetical protein